MERSLTITAPASALGLLSDAEMRVAAGLAADDAAQDAVLRVRGLAVAEAITDECNVAAGIGAAPTLLRETVTETFFFVNVNELILARRHDVTITSIAVDSYVLPVIDYIADPEAGLLHRLCGGLPAPWRAGKVVVIYAAGFEAVPAILKQEALERFTSITNEAMRDPYVKAESVEVVGIQTKRTEYWAGRLPGYGNGAAGSSGASPALRRFRNMVLP